MSDVAKIKKYVDEEGVAVQVAGLAMLNGVKKMNLNSLITSRWSYHSVSNKYHNKTYEDEVDAVDLEVVLAMLTWCVKGINKNMQYVQMELPYGE